MDQETNYTTIDLWKIMEGLLKRVWVIVLCMLVCGAIAFSCAAFIVTPLYSSQILFYVNNNSISMGSTSLSISSSDISAAKSLVNTYMVILETRTTLNEVISVGGIDCTYGELAGMIEADQVSNTEIFSVTVTSDDPKEAEHIANTIGRVLPDKIANVVDGSSVRIVDYAVVPGAKKSPSISKYTMVGMLAGLVLSCGVIIIIELLDDRIHTEEYLIRNYGDIPLLSVIPDMLDHKDRRGYYYKYSRYGYGYGNSSQNKQQKPQGTAVRKGGAQK